VVTPPTSNGDFFPIAFRAFPFRQHFFLFGGTHPSTSFPLCRFFFVVFSFFEGASPLLPFSPRAELLLWSAPRVPLTAGPCFDGKEKETFFREGAYVTSDGVILFPPFPERTFSPKAVRCFFFRRRVAAFLSLVLGAFRFMDESRLW